MINKFLKDFLKYSPSIIIPGIVGFLSVPVLTYFFNPQDYGKYTMIIAIIGIVSSLASWISLSIVRHNVVYEKDGRFGYFYSNILKLTVFSAIAISTLYLFSIYLLKNNYDVDFRTLMFVSSPIIFFTIIIESFKQFLRARNKPGFYSFFESANKAVAFMAGIAIIFFLKTGVIGLLLGMIGTYVLIFPLIFLYSKRGATLKDFKDSKISKGFLSEITRYGIPLMFGNFATWVLSLSDRFIINYFFTAREVGIYSASYRIAEYTVSIIIMLIVFAGTPLLIRTWEKDGYEKSRDLNIKITRFFLLATIPLSVFLSIFSKNIVTILTSRDYTEGYTIIPVIVAGVFLLGLQQRFYAGFFFHKKTNLITYSLVLAAILNIVLNIIFIPRFGYFAAAVSTLVAYSASFVLIVVSSLKLFKWRFPYKTLLKTTLASAIMGVVLYLFNYLHVSPILNLVFGIILSILVYFGVLFLIKELKISDFHFISELRNLKK